MTLYFVSGQGWSGWLREYMIAGMWSGVLEYKREGEGRKVQIFIKPEEFEQFTDELDNVQDFWPDTDDEAFYED